MAIEKKIKISHLPINQFDIMKFSKLESYNDFITNKSNSSKSGVYIWGFIFADNKFMPYYVGKHRGDILKRVITHHNGICNGTHKILKKEIIENSGNLYFSTQDISYLAYINKKVNGKHFPKRMLSVEEQQKLSPHIDFYTSNLYITYLSVDNFDISKPCKNSLIDVLESYIQQLIGIKNLSCRAGVKLPPEFRPVISCEPAIKHIFTNYPLP